MNSPPVSRHLRETTLANSRLRDRVAALERAQDAATPSVVVFQMQSIDEERPQRLELVHPYRATPAGYEWTQVPSETDDDFDARIRRDLGSARNTLHVVIRRFAPPT